MTIRATLFALVGAAALWPSAARAQAPSPDAVIARIWAEGMDSSQTYGLAQVLMDSIGPRLTASPGHQSAAEWLLRTYGDWGIAARQETYGTWRGWSRGITHLDLLAPRVRTLEGTMLAWSPGTDGPVEGGATVLPEVTSPSAFDMWLSRNAGGNFVLMSFPEPTCRPDQQWEEWATAESFQRMREARDEARQRFQLRFRNYGVQSLGELADRLVEAGALGLLTTRWSQGWGVNKIFGAPTDRVPSLDLSCEDYGLVYRLAEHDQGPRLRLDAESAFLGELPAFNVIGEIPGERSDEYVLLSAHLDSWDGASGATDNGTGTITMLEAMRILRKVYPSPKRTIVVGHWGGEELGLIGSGAFAEDHPEVVDGLQAAFNQDNGTWRIEYIRMQGFSRAGERFTEWFEHIPETIARHVELDIPGIPERGGSDHMSFICRGSPGFRLQSSYPEYRQYTWHTNRDTFDKIVFDDLRNNATLAAMLVYLASEDEEPMPRDRRVLPEDPDTGRQLTWPRCGTPRRSSTAN